MPAERAAQVLVIGGGLHGLAAAWHLRRLGARSVILVERFRLGHDRASSHGPTRITRSAYPSAAYVHLLRAANREEWPRLEREVGTPLRHPARACFFGPPGGLFDAFARTMSGFAKEVAFLAPSEAAARFPELRFEGTAGALEDRTAGVIAAERTMRGLARLCRKSDVEILEERRVLRLETRASALRAFTERETIVSERVVVAAGAWSLDLLPFLRSRFTVLRQTVGYFRPGAGSGDAPDFPIWAYLGSDRNDFYYGLPGFEGGGLKAARHVTGGPPDDPERDARPRSAALEDLTRLVNRVFTVPVLELLGADSCLYSVTPTEDFLIDLHPDDPRIAFGAGFSGHGFKFGPLTGRILAELALGGASSVPEFNEHRKTFRL
jgi:monomeric sarcosine oxidase